MAMQRFHFNRVLTTEVRYPTLQGSKGHETLGSPPATEEGPFPVIVFAHGYDLQPSDYQTLLDAWVRAGFVVVAPVFPDENTARVTALGGPGSVAGAEAENDVVNEPGDVAFVLRQFAAMDAPGSGSSLSGIADLSEVALAGQSDGANVVAALAYGSAYRSTWASISPEPRAIVVLSGQALYDGPGGTVNAYSSTAASPDVLQVQSDADVCNGRAYAADLYGYLDNAPVHLFELLHGAAHLQPYMGRVAGPNPYAPVVQRLTTLFFRLALGARSSHPSLASLIAAGTSPVSTMFVAPYNLGPTITKAVAQDSSACLQQLP
jgi:hypothetical protein